MACMLGHGLQVPKSCCREAEPLLHCLAVAVFLIYLTVLPSGLRVGAERILYQCRAPVILHRVPPMWPSLC